MPNQRHPNSDSHNWLIYEINDRFLQRSCKYYRGTLYDLGCAESPYKDFFLRYASSYVGVDWGDSLHALSADMLADLNEPLPIPSQAADTVVSMSVLEHLSRPRVMLGEAHRILKPGGWFVLQVPFQWWMHGDPHDYFRYTSEGLRMLLSEAGFESIVVEPTGGFFTMSVMKLNYFSLRSVRGPRPVRRLMRLVLPPLWLAGQHAAPWLDRLDQNWALEAPGYWAVARKGDGTRGAGDEI
jgi:SAM-dependent methyltransferase